MSGPFFLLLLFFLFSTSHLIDKLRNSSWGLINLKWASKQWSWIGKSDHENRHVDDRNSWLELDWESIQSRWCIFKTTKRKSILVSPWNEWWNGRKSRTGTTKMLRVKSVRKSSEGERRKKKSTVRPGKNKKTNYEEVACDYGRAAGGRVNSVKSWETSKNRN